MKVKGLLVLLVAICCLKAVAGDGIRRLAPFGDVLLHSSENILVGDVNGDGRVDMVDVTLTIRHLTLAASDEFPEQVADVNRDSSLTAADIPLIVNIILGGGCPDSHHPHLIDLGLPSGTKWACCNVGASTPEAPGRFYAWGHIYVNNPFLYNWDMYNYGDYDYNYPDDFHEMRNIGSDIAGTDYDVAKRSWGAPWRMPTLEQCCELIEYTSSVWISVNGVWGRQFTGRNGCSIFMPAAGDIFYDEHDFDGESGLYWTSSLVDEYPCAAYHFGLSSMKSYTDYYFRFGGRTVRPVSND